MAIQIGWGMLDKVNEAHIQALRKVEAFRTLIYLFIYLFRLVMDFIYLFIYLFIGCVESSLLCTGFL